MMSKKWIQSLPDPRGYSIAHVYTPWDNYRQTDTTKGCQQDCSSQAPQCNDHKKRQILDQTYYYNPTRVPHYCHWQEYGRAGLV